MVKTNENPHEGGHRNPSRRELLAAIGGAVTALVTGFHGKAEAAQSSVKKVEYKKSGNARIAHANGYRADAVHAALAAKLEAELTEELQRGGDFMITGFKATHGHKKFLFGMEYTVYLRPVFSGEKPHKFFTIRGTVQKSRAKVMTANAQKVEQAKRNLADPIRFANPSNIDIAHLETNIHAVSHTNPGEKLYHEAVLILGRPR